MGPCFPDPPCAPADVARIHELIVDLATYERAADQVRSTPGQLHEALFGPQPAAYALVAEADDYGRRLRPLLPQLLHLGRRTRDLPGGPYVAPEQRGLGLGKALLAGLAAIAVDWGSPGWSGRCWTGTSPSSTSTVVSGRSRWTSGRSSAGRPGSAAGGHRTTPTGGPACRTD